MKYLETFFKWPAFPLLVFVDTCALLGVTAIFAGLFSFAVLFLTDTNSTNVIIGGILSIVILGGYLWVAEFLYFHIRYEINYRKQ